MPCQDYTQSDAYRAEEIALYQSETRLVSAALCLIIRAHGIEHILSKLDNKALVKQCGVDKKFVAKWWKKHEAEDRARERREKEEKRRKQLKKKALGKLSDEEKQLLGLPISKGKK